MIVASDITGLFLLPLSVTMHNYAYDIMNQMGLIFIPFLLLIVKEFFESRALGADNGSAAVMYLKTLEVGLIKKFFILLVFVMPVTNSSATFSFNQYSQNSYPSILEGSETISALNPNTNFSSFLGQGQMPFAFGLLNNISTGLSNSLTAKIPCTVSTSTSVCTKDVNAGAIMETLDSVRPSQQDNNKAIAEFAESCYNPALTNYLRATENDTEVLNLATKSFPDNSSHKYAFFTDFMKDLYSGVYGIDGFNDQPQLYITTSDAWSSTSVGSHISIKCQYAADSLYESLYGDMQSLNNYDHLETIMGAWVDYFQRYSGGANEMVPTDGLAQQEMISAMFLNSYKDSNEEAKSFFDHAVDSAVDSINESGVIQAGYAVEHLYVQQYNALFEEGMEGKHGFDTLKTFGMNALHLGSAGVGVAEAYTTAQIYGRTFPALLQLAAAAVLMFSPIVILLSGYNGRTTYQICLMYIGLCFSPYVFELGQVMGNSLIMASTDFSFTINEHGTDQSTTSTLEGIWLGYKMPLILVGLWNLLIFVISRAPMPHSVINVKAASFINSREVDLVVNSFNDGIQSFSKDSKEYASLEKAINYELDNMPEAKKERILKKFRR